MQRVQLPTLTKESLLHYSRFLLSIAILFFLCLLATRGLLFHNGLIVSYDAEYHAARTANYYLALKEGQFPPRWAPNLNGNFGYPVFLMVYPLPYMLTTPLFILTKSIEHSVNLVMITSLFLAAFGAWTLGAIVTRRPWPALAAGVLYGLSPYLLVTLYVKGAVAEALFIGFVPWVFVALLTAKYQRHPLWQLVYFLSLFGVFLAHHISLMILLPVLLLWGIARWWSTFSHFAAHTARTTWLSENWRLVVIGELTALSTSFFWIPLLLEKKNTNIDHSRAVVEYQKDFVQLGQLLWSKWGYGGFEPNTINEKFTLMVGVSLWAVVFVGFFYAVKSIRSVTSAPPRPAIQSASLSPLLFWLIIFISSLILMMPISQLVWELFPALQYIQFPWRLLWLSALSGTMVFLYSTQIMRRRHAEIVLIGVSVTFATYQILFWAKPVGYFSHDTYYWMEYPLSSTSYDELQPRWFDKMENFRLTEKVVLRPQGERVFETLEQKQPNTFGSVAIEQWSGSAMRYRVSLERDGDILQKTAYFPGWEVRVNGERVAPTIDDTEFPGRIVIPVSAGDHTIEAGFTQQLIHRQVADVLSIVGYVGVAGCMIHSLIRKEK